MRLDMPWLGGEHGLVQRLEVLHHLSNSEQRSTNLLTINLTSAVRSQQPTGEHMW